MRHIYVVTYDICNPKRLRKVFKTMKGFGTHLELSVFQCDLPDRDRVDLLEKLAELINHREDQILILDLGPSDGNPIKNVQYLGKPVELVQRSATIV